MAQLKLQEPEPTLREIANRDVHFYKMRDLMLQKFAVLVESATIVGQAVVEARQAGCPWYTLGKKVLMLKCTVGMLQQLQKIGATYGEIDQDTVYSAALWGVAHGELEWEWIGSIAEEHRGWRKLLSDGPFPTILADWRCSLAAREVPPADYVVYFLAEHLGEVITKHTYMDIACDLAAVFSDQQLPLTSAETIIGQYGYEMLSMDVAFEIAAEAVDVATQNRNQLTTTGHQGDVDQEAPQLNGM